MAKKKLKEKTDKAKKITKPKKEKTVSKRSKGASKRDKSKSQREVTLLEKVKRFFRGVIHEYKQVIWPSPKDVISTSILVIVIMIGLSIYMYIVDLLSVAFIDFLKNLFTKL